METDCPTPLTTSDKSILDSRKKIIWDFSYSGVDIMNQTESH